MFNVIQGGYDVIDAMNYQSFSQDTMNYFNQKFQNWTQNVQSSASNFMDNVVQHYNEVQSIDMAAKANALARMHENFWNTDTIRPLTNIGQLQNCPNQMVRWMAAEPVYRQRMLNQSAEGWGKRYINVQGNDVGVDQFDYRAIYTGSLTEVDDIDEGMSFRNFMGGDEHDESISNLTVENRLDVLESHQHLLAELLMEDRDPGDKWNGKL